MKVRDTARRRPAETASAGVAAALLVLLASLGIDLDPSLQKVVIAGVGLVAAVVTWWSARRA